MTKARATPSSCHLTCRYNVDGRLWHIDALVASISIPSRERPKIIRSAGRKFIIENQNSAALAARAFGIPRAEKSLAFDLYRALGNTFQAFNDRYKRKYRLAKKPSMLQ